MLFKIFNMVKMFFSYSIDLYLTNINFFSTLCLIRKRNKKVKVVFVSDSGLIAYPTFFYHILFFRSCNIQFINYKNIDDNFTYVEHNIYFVSKFVYLDNLYLFNISESKNVIII
jgi:hypothetical protein